MLTLTGDLWIERQGGFSAICRELGVASQGEDMIEAKANLCEAVGAFMESADDEEITRLLARPVRLTVSYHVFEFDVADPRGPVQA